VGVPYEDQDKLFKLFGFAKDTAQRNTNGIGLGLVICEHIVNMFDGYITFDSIPEEGSTFTFAFKLSNDNKMDRNS